MRKQCISVSAPFAISTVEFERTSLTAFLADCKRDLDESTAQNDNPVTVSEKSALYQKIDKFLPLIIESHVMPTKFLALNSAAGRMNACRMLKQRRKLWTSREPGYPYASSTATE